MPSAILAYSRGHPLLGSAKRSVKNTVHWVCQLCALSASLGGLAIIVTNKDVNGSPHFTTRHGLFGVITVALSVGASMGDLQLNVA